MVAFSLAALCLAGCATIRTVRDHPAQARLDRLAALVMRQTGHPNERCWVRALDSKPFADLLVLQQRHVYLSEAVLAAADDRILGALLGHAVAHHELRHHGKRNIIQLVQYVAFQVAGAFVPGLGLGTFLVYPVVEQTVTLGQEFSADVKTMEILKPLEYSDEEYFSILEFLRAHHMTERVGGVFTKQEGFTSRIAALRKRSTRQDSRPTRR